MIDCLKAYERASGQMINFQKSSISFSRNMHENLKEEICSFLRVSSTENHGNYLGLPSLVGKNKKAIFAFIKDKTWQMINGWKMRLLSKAGKEILLKSVIQSIPSYLMSVFLIPLSLCAELERMMNSFWLGKQKDSQRGIH